MPNDVVTMIKADHHELQRLFGMMKSDKSSRPLAAPLAVAMLAAHSQAEEVHVYPVLAKEAHEREEAKHSTEEHHQAEKLGKKLLKADPESSDFDRALDEFVSAVLHHMDEEETDILPALQRTLKAGRLRKLGQAFAARRAKALTGQGSNGRSVRSTRLRKARTGETLVDLYQEARELGIQGRSSMGKAQLARAVHRQRSAKAR